MLRFLLALICFMTWTSVRAAEKQVKTIVLTPIMLLDVAQKTSQSDVIEAMDEASKDKESLHLECRRDHVNKTVSKQNDHYCEGRWIDVQLDSVYVDLQIAQKTLGHLVDQSGVPEGSIRFVRTTGKNILMTGLALTKLRAFVEGAFQGTTLEAVDKFTSELGPVVLDKGTKQEKTELRMLGRASYFDTFSAATHTTLQKMGFVAKPVKRVP